MKDIKELLFGKVSKEKIDMFSNKIKELNKKINLGNDDKIENHITIVWNNIENQSLIKIEGLDKNIENKIISIFNEIFK